MRPALSKISGPPLSAVRRGAGTALAFGLLFAACESNPGDLIHNSSKPPLGGQTSSGGAPQDGKGGSATGGASGGISALGGTSSGGGGVTALGGTPSTGGAAALGGAGGISSAGGAGGTSGGGTSSAGTGGAASGGAAPNEGGSAGEGCASKELCDGIDNDCDARVDEEDACPAGCVGLRVLERGMMVCNTPTVADAAKQRCAEQGMRLAWLDSRMKNRAVLMAIEESKLDLVEVFIGATDEEMEGRWHWIGGSDFWRGADNGSSVSGAFANWASGKPNNAEEGQSCAVLIVNEPDDGQAGQWDDVGCTEEHGVLCESPEPGGPR